MIHCKNCALEFESKFCPDCGQKSSVKRLTTRDIFTDFLKKVLPWDKGFLYTLRRLLLSPGRMVREYLDGKRMNYSKPLQFLFIVVAVSFVLLSPGDFNRAMTQNGAVPNVTSELSMKITTWVFAHIAILFSGLIPFLAIFSKLLYRKAHYNYAEHLVLNLYVMAGVTLVNMPFSSVAVLLESGMIKSLLTGIGLTLNLLFFVWAYFQFFRPTGKIWGAIKPLLVYALGYLLYILAMGLVIVCVGAVYLSIFGKPQF